MVKPRITVNRKKCPYQRRQWQQRWINRIMNADESQVEKLEQRYYPELLQGSRQRYLDLFTQPPQPQEQAASKKTLFTKVKQYFKK